MKKNLFDNKLLRNKLISIVKKELNCGYDKIS